MWIAVDNRVARSRMLTRNECRRFGSPSNVETGLARCIPDHVVETGLVEEQGDHIDAVECGSEVQWGLAASVLSGERRGLVFEHQFNGGVCDGEHELARPS